MDDFVSIADLRNYFRDFLHWDEYFRLMQVSRTCRKFLGGFEVDSTERMQVFHRFILDPLLQCILGKKGVPGFYEELYQLNTRHSRYLANYLQHNYWISCHQLEQHYQSSVHQIGRNMGLLVTPPPPVRFLDAVAQNGVDRLAKMYLPDTAPPQLAFPGLIKAFNRRRTTFPLPEILQVLRFKSQELHPSIEAIISALSKNRLPFRPLAQVLKRTIKYETHRISLSEVLGNIYWDICRLPGWVYSLDITQPQVRHLLIYKPGQRGRNVKALRFLFKRQFPDASQRPSKRKWGASLADVHS